MLESYNYIIELGSFDYDIIFFYQSVTKIIYYITFLFIN